MHRLLLAISVLFVLAATATVAAPQDLPQAATPPSAPEAKSPSSEAPKKPPPSVQNKTKGQAAEERKIADQLYDNCLRDWDAATHMTKQEWQRTCRRMANERTKFRSDLGSGYEPRSR